MANNPDSPRDNGKIGLPTIATGMLKTRPTANAEDERDTKGGQLGDEDKAEDEKILQGMRKDFERSIASDTENRREMLDDKKFLTGQAQWPADVASQRNFDHRPCLTENKLPVFVNQVVNDIRQNRPNPDVSPVGDKGDKEVAKFYRGMIRSIERRSRADIAYDTAAFDQVSCGRGFWRLITDYVSPTSMLQQITIKRIRNQMTVYPDPTSQEPDGSDYKYCFVSELMPRKQFEEMYPDASVVSIDQFGIGDTFKDWLTTENIRIAEYWKIKKKKRKLVQLSNGHTGWEDELDDHIKDMIANDELEIIKERDSFEQTVMFYKVTAIDILERTEWPGKYIPIFPVLGNEIDVDGKSQLSGLIRNAKDAQRRYNYGITTEIEITMLAPKAPYIMEEGQVEGHEDQWKSANIKNMPYLLYRAVNAGGAPAPPPQRNPVAQIPAGVVNITQGAAQGIMATTGIRFDATMNERMNDESGRAMVELRRSGDLGAFHFVDNLSRTMRWCGVVMIDLIPKIYDTAQVVTILREDDEEEQVKIDPHQPQGMTKGKVPADPSNPNNKKTRVQKIFNPTIGEYGVTVIVGPSYATKRIEAAKSLLDFARAVPAALPYIMDLIAKYQDWEGADEMAIRLAKAVQMINPGIIAPDMEDVSPQVQAVLMQLNTQLQQANLEKAQLMKALTDQTADRAVKQDKIEKDFEAKVLSIVQKQQASADKQVGDQLRALADGVNVLRDEMANPSQSDGVSKEAAE